MARSQRRWRAAQKRPETGVRLVARAALVHVGEAASAKRGDRADGVTWWGDGSFFELTGACGRTVSEFWQACYGAVVTAVASMAPSSPCTSSPGGQIGPPA